MEKLTESQGIHILRLPEEILEEIIKYVDMKSRRNLRSVCKHVYKILCGLERDKYPLKISYSQIYGDDETYESIINSKREICDLTIDIEGCRVLPLSDRLAKVVRKFGLRLKKIKIQFPDHGKPVEICDEQLMAILKCIPKVEDLELRYIVVRSSDMQQEELNLFKLRRLVLHYCLFDTPVVLNSLPAEVLNELYFTFGSNDETRFQSFFNRQKNIKKLEISENERITFDHLELEHLKIFSEIDFSVMVAQQPSLKYLDLTTTRIDDNIFGSVTQLAHLEVLRTEFNDVSMKTFRTLSNLSKLKELSLYSFLKDRGHLLELSMMRFEKLEKLTLLFDQFMIPPEIIIQLSLNCRSIKAIEIGNRSLNNLPIISEYFPRLESIVFNYSPNFRFSDILVFDANLRHENLKQIVVMWLNAQGHIPEANNTQALLQLVSACPNLERIILFKLELLTLQDFRNIVEPHQNLTHLSLEFESFEFTGEVIQIIRTARKLVYLRLRGLTVLPSFEQLRAVEETFPNITQYWNFNDGAEIVLKKRNTPDWYKDFNLMKYDYF